MAQFMLNALSLSNIKRFLAHDSIYAYLASHGCIIEKRLKLGL